MPTEEEMAPAIAAIQKVVSLPITDVVPPVQPPPDPDEHGMLVMPTGHGTVFVRGVGTAMELSVEQLDRIVQRLLDARAPEDGKEGGSSASSFDEGIHIYAQDGVVELVAHKLALRSQVNALVVSLKQSRAKAVAIRVATARAKLALAQAELDAALKL